MNLKAYIRRKLLLFLYRTLMRFGYEIRKTDTNDLPDLQEVLGQISRPMIFDVGCNQGVITEKYLATWPDAQLHCFEALPDVADLAVKRFSGRPAVEVHNLALCDRTGSIAFNRMAASDSSSLLQSNEREIPASYKDVLATTAVLEVPCDTLDRFCNERGITSIDLLKLDVQGAEWRVLRGATVLLERRAIKVIVSEVYFLPFYDSQPMFEDIAELLQSFGYRFVLPYNLVFGSTTGRIQWADAMFVAPGVKVPKQRWITNRR